MTDPFWPMSEEELAQQEEVVLDSPSHEAPVEDKKEKNDGKYVAVVGLTPSENNNHKYESRPEESASESSKQDGDRKVRFDTEKGVEDDKPSRLRNRANGHVKRHVTSQPVGTSPTVYLVSNDQTGSYSAGATVLTLDQSGQDQVVHSPEWVQVQEEAPELIAVQTQPGWLITQAVDGQPTLVHAQPTVYEYEQQPTLVHAQPGMYDTSQQPTIVHAAPGMYDVSQSFTLQTANDVEEEYVIVVSDEDEDQQEKPKSGWCC